MGWMLDIVEMPGWKKCATCGYAEDENGENEVTRKMAAESIQKENIGNSEND
jgi:hypothetical protein